MEKVRDEILCSILSVFLFQMFTPLHAAAASGQISVVRLLLELGAEVDGLNVHDNTSLHVACLNGQDIVASELISYKSSLNALNRKGQVIL